MRRVALAALLLATACNGDPGENAGRPCAGLLRSPDPSVTLPVPAGLDGLVVYELQKQGSTNRYNAQLATGDDVVAVRNRILDAFAADGFTIDSLDEEPPAEAEFGWTKDDKEGSVQVTPVCHRTVHVRYRVGPR